MPEISFTVVITCYNHAAYISDAVDSALAQSRAPSQVIVVDDASTDSSLEALRHYQDSIELIAHSRNQGISRTRNAGTARATGDYLVYLDGDDVLKPWALASYDQILRTHRASIILASLTWFEGSCPPCGPADFPRAIEVVEYKRMADKDRSFRSSASAIVVEREKVLAAHGWTENVALMQDHDLLAKLAEVGPAIQVLSPATVFYRSHPSNSYKDTARLLNDCYSLLAAWRTRPEGRSSARNLVGGPVFLCCSALAPQNSIAKPLAYSPTVGGSSPQPPGRASALSSSGVILRGSSPSTSARPRILRSSSRTSAIPGKRSCLAGRWLISKSRRGEFPCGFSPLLPIYRRSGFGYLITPCCCRLHPDLRGCPRAPGRFRQPI